MRINSTFRLALAQKLGVNQLLSADLSCGNGAAGGTNQMSASNNIFPKDGSASTSDVFDTPCFYTSKGDYILELRYTYLDKPSQQQREGKLSVGTIRIPAEIVLTNE
jgi:hypothetical protein